MLSTSEMQTKIMITKTLRRVWSRMSLERLGQEGWSQLNLIYSAITLNLNTFIDFVFSYRLTTMSCLQTSLKNTLVQNFARREQQ